MGEITSVIKNIASTQEGIMKKMDWITDAATELTETPELLAFMKMAIALPNKSIKRVIARMEAGE